MGVKVEVIDAACRPPGPEWDAFVSGQGLAGFWHGGPLHEYGTASVEGVQLARAAIDGETAALACFRGWRPPGGVGFKGRRRWARPLLLRCLVPVSFNSGLAFADGLDVVERGRLLRAMERAVRRRLGRACRGVMYESVTGTDRDLFAKSRVVVRQAPLAVLPVRWPDLDGYLATLPRRRRQRFAALMARVDRDPSVEAFDLSPTIDPVEATRLELATRQRHQAPGAPVWPLPARYLTSLAATGTAGFFGFRRPSGELLQFDIALPTHDRLVTTATGAADRSVASQLYHALYLREIAYAAERGMTALDFGPGALPDKLRFGCETHPRFAYLSLRS